MQLKSCAERKSLSVTFSAKNQFGMETWRKRSERKPAKDSARDEQSEYAGVRLIRSAYACSRGSHLEGRLWQGMLDTQTIPIP